MGILDAITGVDKDIYQPSPTPQRLKKAEKVLILTGDNTEDLEFFYPYYRLTEEGYTVDVATVDGEEFSGKRGLGLNKTLEIKSVRAEEYALIYIPGGKAPSDLREDAATLNLVRNFAMSGKPIAAICHGIQVLISAGIAKGQQMACAEDVREELERAGGVFVDEALVESGQYITARKPGDLPRHLYGVLDYLQGREGSRKGSRTAAA